MLESQRAQRFPASPTNPNAWVLAEFFPASGSQPTPFQPYTILEEEKQWCPTLNPLAFLSDLSAQKTLPCLAGFFLQEFRAPNPKMLFHAAGHTLCSCNMSIDPLSDHVLTCKKHTGSIRGHNHLMDVLANSAEASKLVPCVSRPGYPGAFDIDSAIEVATYLYKNDNLRIDQRLKVISMCLPSVFPFFSTTHRLARIWFQAPHSRMDQSIQKCLELRKKHGELSLHLS